MFTITNRHLVAASMFAIASLAAPAIATAQSVTVDSTGEVRSTSISYAPGDLTTDSGAQAMWGRIEQASRLVCGGRPDIRDLSRRAVYDRCRRETETRVLGSLNAPLVTAAASQSGSILMASK